MEKLKPTSPKAQEIVKSFSEHVVWLLSASRIFTELYEDKDIELVLRSTGESFFTDLNRILQNYVLLQCAKLSDRKSTNDKDNLTVDFITDRIDWSDNTVKKLKKLRDAILGFRSKIIDARNEILSHSGLKTALSNKVLGAFVAGEDKVFMENLVKICDIAYREVFASPFSEVWLGLSGDVLDFKMSLWMANAFRKLLEESTGDDKLRLYEMLISEVHPKNVG